eukprot:COSAG02_NODE_67710_length_252_cov_0.679739_1_plen_72_part_10
MVWSLPRIGPVYWWGLRGSLRGQSSAGCHVSPIAEQSHELDVRRAVPWVSFNRSSVGVLSFSGLSGCCSDLC